MSGSVVHDLTERLLSEFAASWGGVGAPRVFFAPGRVNLVGAHLDYNGGDVLPLAVNRGIYVAASLRNDNALHLRSLDLPEAVTVDSAAIGERGDPAHGWASYPLGVWREFAECTGIRQGADLLFAGDVTMASGLSSSAALEVATATALDALHGVGMPPEDLAYIAHRAETEYVGLKCGIMDQFASALGRAGHALLLHCSEPRYEHVPLDPGALEILVMDTRKPRPLATTGFNERVQECSAAHAAMRGLGRDRPHLAAYVPDDLTIAAKLPENLRRRFRHVVSEMQRVAGAVAALRSGDMHGLGAALDASHESTRVDYEVSCAELDAITDAARACADVFGARLTGAGFGGCAIALVRPGACETVAAAVRAAHEDQFGVTPRFDVLRAGPGHREVT